MLVLWAVLSSPPSPSAPAYSIGEVCAERRDIFNRLAAVEVPDPSGGLRAMQHATATWLKARLGCFVVVLLGPLVLVLFLGPAGLGRGGPCRAVCLIRTRLLVCCLLGWHGGAGIGSALTASSSAGVVAKAFFVFRNAGARGDCRPDCQHEPGALRVHDLCAGQLWMGAHPLPGKLD